MIYSSNHIAQLKTYYVRSFFLIKFMDAQSFPSIKNSHLIQLDNIVFIICIINHIIDSTSLVYIYAKWATFYQSTFPFIM